MKKFCFNFILSVILFTISLTAGQKPVDYVNVFMGTSNSRWMMFPGPARPFGMVKLSPDNQSNVWCGGYEYTVHSISGFSHIHSWAMGGLSVMPTTGDVKTFPGPSDGPFKNMWTAGYRSRIKKSTEKGKPGYYKVNLFDYDIDVELTSTTRCGYLRLTYPESKNANLLFNFNFDYEENEPEMLGAYIRRVSDTEIEGYIKQKSSFADKYTVHFVARFDKPMKKFRSWENEKFEGNNLYGINWQKKTNFYKQAEKKLQGECGAVVTFETSEDETIEVQTGISLVSIEQARLNLNEEMNQYDWDFSQVVDNSQEVWNDLIGQIEVEGGTREDRIKFYTCLYRAYCSRTQWNDVNGKYVDMCEKEQQLEPPADAIYGCDAFWGSQWNLNPLWTMLTPDYANSWVNSLLEIYNKGGWLPKGPTGIEYSSVMVASHEISLIVSAFQKGIRNFDIDKAYEAIKHVQTTPGQEHECGGHVGNRNLESYLKYGYVPNQEGPVSNTMEYAYDDWCVSQLAKALGKDKDYRTFYDRSQNYKNAFDKETRYIRQKNRDGSWVEKWSPLENHGTWYGSGYVEGTAWHYTFFVPHDLPGMQKLVGEDLFLERLLEGFEKNYINIGNQPNMQAPYLFNYTQEPWHTQKYIRKLMQTEFTADPYIGWAGEEDQGQMSAFFALSAMGLFEMKGGCSVEPYYDIGSPLFDKITIHLDDEYYSGKDFVIIAENNSPENIYIQDARLNGEKLDKPLIYHKDLIKGGKLELIMGNKPNKKLW